MNMKNTFKKILILTVVVASSFACRDEDVVRVPKFKNAPNYRMVIDPDNSFFNIADLGTAKLKYDIYTEIPNELETVEVIFRYQKAGQPACNLFGCSDPFTVKTYTRAQLVAAKGIIKGEEITVQQVLALLGKTESDLGGGDAFLFTNKVTMTDGRVYPTSTPNNNTNIPTIFNQVGASYTATFSALVGCPYSSTDIVGTYNVLEDAFAVRVAGHNQVQVVSVSGTQFRINNVFGHAGPLNMTCTVNPVSGAITVDPRQYTWVPAYFGLVGYGNGYAATPAANGSTVFTCIGRISLKLSYSVDIGSYGGVWNYTLQKQ
jgi:hypothetical protein